MHGGKSLAWFAHPNYKHGLYSKYVPVDLAVRKLIQRLKREEEELTRDVPSSSYFVGWSEEQSGSW